MVIRDDDDDDDMCGCMCMYESSSVAQYLIFSPLALIMTKTTLKEPTISLHLQEPIKNCTATKTPE